MTSELSPQLVECTSGFATPILAYFSASRLVHKAFFTDHTHKAALVWRPIAVISSFHSLRATNERRYLVTMVSCDSGAVYVQHYVTNVPWSPSLRKRLMRFFEDFLWTLQHRGMFSLRSSLFGMWYQWYHCLVGQSPIWYGNKPMTQTSLRKCFHVFFFSFPFLCFANSLLHMTKHYISGLTCLLSLYLL